MGPRRSRGAEKTEVLQREVDRQWGRGSRPTEVTRCKSTLMQAHVMRQAQSGSSQEARDGQSQPPAIVVPGPFVDYPPVPSSVNPSHAQSREIIVLGRLPIAASARL